MSTQNGCSPATFLIETESRNTSASEQNMVVIASDGPSPHSPSLRLGFPTPQSSRRHLRPFLLQLVSIVSSLLNHRNPIFEPVCVFYPFLNCLYFSDRNELQL